MTTENLKKMHKGMIRTVTTVCDQARYEISDTKEAVAAREYWAPETFDALTGLEKQYTEVRALAEYFQRCCSFLQAAKPAECEAIDAVIGDELNRVAVIHEQGLERVAAFQQNLVNKITEDQQNFLTNFFEEAKGNKELS